MRRKCRRKGVACRCRRLAGRGVADLMMSWLPCVEVAIGRKDSSVLLLDWPFRRGLIALNVHGLILHLQHNYGLRTESATRLN